MVVDNRYLLMEINTKVNTNLGSLMGMENTHGMKVVNMRDSLKTDYGMGRADSWRPMGTSIQVFVR